jgi:hypothetical protein
VKNRPSRPRMHKGADTADFPAKARSRAAALPPYAMSEGAAGDTSKSLGPSLARAARALAELSVETMCYDEIRESLCTVLLPFSQLRGPPWSPPDDRAPPHFCLCQVDRDLGEGCEDADSRAELACLSGPVRAASFHC